LADWDLVDLDPAQLASEFRRILKPTGNAFIFMSYNLVGRYHEAFDPLFDTFQMMVWHKTNPIPNFFKAGFLNSCELLAACWDKGHTWNFKTQKEMHNFFEGPICMGHERIKGADGAVLHPTQKPLRILSHIIEIASKPGDLVFDPFMGVCSTGAACQKLDRRFLGAEIDPTYFTAGCKRLGIATNPKSGKSERALKMSIAALLPA
jgi:site-specific DNA-methyltransferase (adenine-specific)/modification methylase